MEEYLALGQGVYFFVTGIWPLVSIGTFQQVTGSKTDLWLVKTVGVVVGVIGAALLVAGLQGTVSLELVIVAAGSAAGLMLIDIIYVFKNVIARIYLLDALVEFVLATGWLITQIP